jgi:hypothetical protein
MTTFKRVALAIVAGAIILAGGPAAVKAAPVGPGGADVSAAWECTSSKDKWGFIVINCVYHEDPIKMPTKPPPKPPTLPAN